MLLCKIVRPKTIDNPVENPHKKITKNKIQKGGEKAVKVNNEPRQKKLITISLPEFTKFFFLLATTILAEITPHVKSN